ncbi:MAG: Nif3-like dinuclear metal center hexameric protein [Acidobacteriota bacterium]|nr:Nif3-like dinuclear metal center hexameric protein [Acidobacteriota bacterium]
MRITRRDFGLMAGSAAVARADGLTAGDVVQRLLGEGATITVGDPAMPVRGIATTAMATVDVLRQAAKQNANLVLTYEPAFFSKAERPMPDDPVYSAKKEFIEKNGLVVARVTKIPNMLEGLADSLGWSKHRVKAGDALYEIPAASAEQTVAAIRSKLNLRGGLRAVGDRKAQVRRVLLHPGPMTPAIMWARYTEVDMVVAGEVREWENTHYAADIFTAGQKRNLVTVGRVMSEDPGMRLFAESLKSVVKEAPATFIAAGDAYWRAV